MKFLLSSLICLILFGLLSCEDPPLPEPVSDVKITGTILNASDQSPLSGIVLNTLMGRNVRSQLTTDTEGKFTFEIMDLRQYFIEGGMSEADADTLLAQDEIYLSINSGSGNSDCQYFSIDPALPQYRSTYYPSLPIADTWDFNLHESEIFQFAFRDTASNPRSEKILGAIRVRELNQPEPYARWTPLELELRDNISNVFCLPIDIALEITYQLVAYPEGSSATPLYEKEFKDTITMTNAGLPVYEISY